MALPPGFESYDQYFRASLSFLKEHDYIFNFANTDILLNNTLKNVSYKWQKHLKFVEEKKVYKLNVESSVSDESKQYEIFNKNLHKLLPSVIRFEYDNAESIKQKPLNGLSPKKQHEIFKLSELIHEQCKKKNVTHIIDLGSGLGYLSQLMYEKYEYSVLGIESDEIRLSGALKRQKKNYKSSAINVKYVRHFVTAESENTLMELVKENFDKCERFCLVGLHACGDLAVNAIKLFLQIKECELLAIMPCCYHKMAFKTNEVYEVSNENLTAQCQNISIAHNALKSTKELDKHNTIEEGNIKDTRICHSFDINLKQVDNESNKSVNSWNKDEFIFENVPLSKSLKNSYQLLNAAILLRRPFLRLACQRVQSGWKKTDGVENNTRVFHLMSRAVLQLYAFKENAKLVKVKRRAVRKIQSKKCDIESFLDDAINRGYTLQLNNDQKKMSSHLTSLSSEDSNSYGLKSFANFNADLSFSARNIDTSTYNNASGNCSDSIEQPLQKSEQSKLIRQEDAAEGKTNEACSVFGNAVSYRHTNTNVSIDNNAFLEFDKNKILHLWNGLCHNDFEVVSLLLDLQDTLQALCENVVLLDKIAFLHESNETFGGLSRFEFIKVTDDNLSPRCHALVANK